MHPVACINTHHDVTDLINHGMVKNTKTWISWERNITFLRNKRIFNMCLMWHILRSYRFVAEVTFKIHQLKQRKGLGLRQLNPVHKRPYTTTDIGDCLTNSKMHLILLKVFSKLSLKKRVYFQNFNKYLQLYHWECRVL